MLLADWSNILGNILQNESNEALISSQFAQPLIKALGFSEQEQIPQFATGNGPVDFAVRKNTSDNIFSHSRENPYLLVEIKARATSAGNRINLSEGTAQYKSAVEQLKRYLLAPRSKTAQWGIITNVDSIQLFRRHGKVVIPATQNFLIKKENINEIVTEIKNIITNPPKALTVCVYNEKGGVGKTTTTINLAATLWKNKKRVIVLDFDSHRGLTKSLGINIGTTKLSDCLGNTTLNIKDSIQPFKLKDSQSGKEVRLFDVIPADPDIRKYMNYEYEAQVQKGAARLRELLTVFVKEYDYILIDCPIEWRFFSKSSVYASDTVLIPTKHSDLQSIDNAANVIKNYIPEIQKERKNGGPIALPIFFNDSNGTKIPEAQLKIAKAEIRKIIERERKNPERFDLLPYYCPKIRQGSSDDTIFSIPAHAIISNAAFSRTPAIFRHKTVAEYYLNLAKEYFLYE